MSKFGTLLKLLLALLAFAVTLSLRLRAVEQLPIDYDEDDYLLAAQHYAQAIKAGDLGDIVNYDYNHEHPPLTKLLYGWAITPLKKAPPIREVPSTAPPARFFAASTF